MCSSSINSYLNAYLNKYQYTSCSSITVCRCQVFHQYVCLLLWFSLQTFWLFLHLKKKINAFISHTWGIFVFLGFYKKLFKKQRTFSICALTCCLLYLKETAAIHLIKYPASGLSTRTLIRVPLLNLYNLHISLHCHALSDLNQNKVNKKSQGFQPCGKISCYFFSFIWMWWAACWLIYGNIFTSWFSSFDAE